MLIPASPEAVVALPGLDPLLAWGVLTRGLGVVYAIAFASIAVQIRGLAGRDGMSPFAPMMQQMAHDFPGWRRLLYFPTLLWLTGGGDAALVGLPVAGVGFGLAAAYGGAASPLALAACWATLRSLDLPVGLLYPWDSLLLEAGALATLLPPLPPLNSAVAAAAAPHPSAVAAPVYARSPLLYDEGPRSRALLFRDGVKEVDGEEVLEVWSLVAPLQPMRCARAPAAAPPPLAPPRRRG